jgi:UDP-N-acetylglucosamine 2-epimerase (non-hydrolysing)/GDP/UDP-N,N'-diacetylbacillosamine 2-epimerase (hydrolysing)
MSRRHVCVLTGKRGGFGALTPTMEAIAARPDMRLSILVTDQHLYERFGKTVAEVKARFEVAAAIDMEQRGDEGRDRARAIGVCLAKAADVLADMAPDVLVIIGDRGEVMAAAIAAHNLKIAIAHIQGGDLSGSLDDGIRHAATKLAHIHFPSSEMAARRIIAMGEEPWRVHVVGDTHVDQLLLRTNTPAAELRRRYDLPDAEPFLLVLQHSDATVPEQSRTQMAETVAAATSFGLRTLFVYPCSDQGYEGIIAEIEAVRGRPGVSVHPNIPAPDFAGLQAIAGCLVGNSSAGLIEAPYFGLPAINVGDRQRGRDHTDNVIHVPYDRARIRAAIDRGLYDAAFRASIKGLAPPFGDGTAYRRITEVLATVPLDARLLNKWMAY